MSKYIVVFLSSIATGLALLAYLLFSQLDYLPAFHELAWLYSATAAISGLAGLGIHFMRESFIHRILPWGTKVLPRFVLQVVLLLVFVVAVALLMVWMFSHSLFSVFYSDTIDTFEVWGRFVILSFLLVFIYTLIDLALCSYHKYAVEQVRSLRQQRTQLEMQYKALVSQLSPHFLFNNLNTVYSLIHSRAPLAEKYIYMLTQTHQYILGTHHKKVIKLKDELDFVQMYFQMLAIRFDKAIKLRVDVDPLYSDHLIPPMSLQILLENAIKHNAFSKQKPLSVHIYAEKKILWYPII